MIYSKSDFAKLCGLTSGNLTNYINRGKVFMGEDGIDGEDPMNKDFLERRQSRIPMPQNPPPPPPDKKLHMMRPDPGDDEPPITELDDDDDEPDLPGGDYGTSMHLLQKQKVAAEIRKKHREISLLQLREDKLNGEIIPIQVVKDLFSQHNKSVAVHIKNTVENIITQFAKTAGLNVNQIAELRGRALQEINTGMEKSIAETRKGLKIIQHTHSQKKEVGERER